MSKFNILFLTAIFISLNGLGAYWKDPALQMAAIAMMLGLAGYCVYMKFYGRKKEKS